MFAVIYSFEVKPGNDQKLIDAWSGLTDLIYRHEGSLGSRLHHETGNRYLAYAQWPSREGWKEAGANMPAEAEKYRKAMKESCLKIETLHELNPVSDLLQTKPFSK
ncbi:antibiotic biosynthesis monooxygenase [bacterium SCSIO 12741]|nr:antibiotic biosynthesis monooxygenase [bacterium SCSIO 12741]